MAYGKKEPKDNEAFQLFKEKLKSENASGIYLFKGEEEYLKRSYFSRLCSSFSDKGFNLTVFDGDSFSLSDFSDAVNTVASLDYAGGFFGEDEKKPVRIIKIVDPDLSMSSSDEKIFFQLLSSVTDAIVVFYFPYYGTESEKKLSKGIYKELSSVALTVSFDKEPPNSPSLYKWVKKHFEKDGMEIGQKEIQRLIFAVGNDMSMLAFEIEKLCAYAKYKGKSLLSEEDIETVCVKNPEAQTYDVSNAAFRGDFTSAMKAFTVLKESKTEPLLIFGTLSKAAYDLTCVEYYRNKGYSPAQIAEKAALKEFAVKMQLKLLSERKSGFTGRVTELCYRFDEKLKSSRADKYILLENLIFRISCY